MTPHHYRWEPPPLDPRRAIRGSSAAKSLSAVNHRLGKTEYELQIQFTRIAQMQAQLDLVLVELRRVTEGSHRG
jgi:hypothetical protein